MDDILIILEMGKEILADLGLMGVVAGIGVVAHFVLLYGEKVLLTIWNTAYFKSGPILYRDSRHVRLRSGAMPDGDTLAEWIKRGLPKSTGLKVNPFPREIVFQRGDERWYMFRVATVRVGYRYSSIMKGTLTLDSDSGRLTVIGRLRWMRVLAAVATMPFLYLALTWVFTSSMKEEATVFWLFGLFVILFGIFSRVASYRGEMRRFGHILDVIAQEMSR